MNAFEKVSEFYNLNFLSNACGTVINSETSPAKYDDCMNDTLIISANSTDSLIRLITDIVENIGVEKSIKMLNSADLIIYVLNNNEELSEKDIELYNKIKDKKYLIIINKIDLDKNIDDSIFDENNVVRVSALDKECSNIIKNKVSKLYNLSELNNNDLTYLSNVRSISILKQTVEKLDEIRTALNDNLPIDFIELDLRNIWNLLGEIIGETYTDELIDKLFSQFCLGK